MIKANEYRTVTCGELREENIGQQVRVAGWVENIRDHGGVMFLDIRDQYGVLQVVVHNDELLKDINKECTVTLSGTVVKRDEETINKKIATGFVEVHTEDIKVLGKCKNVLPFEVATSTNTNEEVRLKYRFLDLRNPKVHNNIMIRSQIITFLRNKMNEMGFMEIQTPILSTSSPEGARDYPIPSRKHKGRFYALPQAPQIFKQLLMVSGFDRYFQIAPCFRDEDPRADRLPGEFYQLDLEMSFVTQEEVWETMEPVMAGVFESFAEGRKVTPAGDFPRIPYRQAMLDYGTDKPDLRNPLIIKDVTEHFRTSGFGLFEKIVGSGGVVRAVPAPKTAEKSRKFFDDMNEWARSEGHAGLGYVTRKGGEFGGPIAKNHGEEGMQALYDAIGLGPDDGCFFAAGKEEQAAKLAGAARTRCGEQLELIEQDAFRFCWIIDFPFYEWSEEEKKIDFAHNPFSMPQGGLEALESQDPLTIKAYQYDMVCNGYELASGSIRNQHPDLMVKAFELTGLTQADVEERFGGMYRAFQYGAPPHGGMAAGVDRMVMLLCGVQNLREITLFPMNQRAEDLLMGAPSPAELKQLRELHIRVIEQPKQG